MADERKMLVVDDEEVVCQACRRIFSRQGFQVETNTDAEAGPRQGHGKRLHDHPLGHQDAQHGRDPVPGTAPREEARRAGADHHRLSQHPQRGGGHAARRLRLRDQALHLRRGHLGRAAGAEHAARAQRRRGNRRAGTRSGGYRDGQHRDALLGRVLGAACRRRIGAGGGGAAGPPRGLDHRRPHAAASARSSTRACRWPGSAWPASPWWSFPRPSPALWRESTRCWPIVPSCWRPIPAGKVGSPASARRGTRKWRTASRGAWSWSMPIPARPTSKRGSSRPWAARSKRPPNPEALLAALAENGDRVVFLDATSLGEEGPGLVERVNRQAPHARIVVVGSAGGAGEAAYRKHKIFYYAVEPFADNEIADILMGVFHTREVQPAKTEHPKGPSEPISSISITNRNLHKVQLLAAPGCCGATRARAADRAEAAGPDVSRRRHARRNAAHAGQHPQGGRGLRSGHGAPGPRQRPLARRTGPRHETGVRRGAHGRRLPARRARWRCFRCSRTNWAASPASTPGPSPPWPTISFGTWRRTERGTESLELRTASLELRD